MKKEIEVPKELSFGEYRNLSPKDAAKYVAKRLGLDKERESKWKY